MQPNLRNVPFVIDPFAFHKVDAVLATHYHQDHMSAEWAAHVLQSGMTTTDEEGKEVPVPFIGPQKSVDTWVGWGVPRERCRVVHPGDVITIEAGCRHTIIAETELKVIEVQLGREISVHDKKKYKLDR